jgi:hypothetical protein
LSNPRAGLHHRGMEKIEVPADNCPQAPAQLITVHTRVLHRACQVMGGIDRLADYLRVSHAMLLRWLEGDDVPPASVFLKAVDLIVPPWGPDDDAHAATIRAGKPKKN